MREFRPPMRPSKLRWVLLALALVGGVAPAVALSPLLLSTAAVSYAISGGVFTARAGDVFGGERRVRLADVTEARAVQLQRGRRVAGTSMPGYCAGRFTYEDLGPVWQATNCSARAVVVRASTEERPIVITPPDRDAFLEALKAGTETSVTLPAADKGPFKLLALVIPISLVVCGMVVALIVVGPKRMRYLVGDGELQVHTLFGHKRWPTAGARAKAHTPGRLLRVAGAGMPGYFTGIFREDGQTTRVYATDHRRTVLFEGPDRVILSPEDRDGFLDALEKEGVSVQR